jgi:hypothetical protein
MKKFLAIIVLSIFYSGNVYAFFSTQLFQKDKELNLNNFFNFDITKHKFKDHEEIIGKDFTKWDGDPGKKGKDEIDFKMINVLVDGNEQKLKLRKFKDKMWLTLTLDGYNCAQAKEKVPTRFINKNHYKEYVSDFYIMKMHQIQFSHDTKNSRVSFFCMETESSTPDTNPTTILRIAPKKDKQTPQIIPMKKISCQIKEAKTNLKNEWSKYKSSTYLTFYILDDEKKLYDQRKVSTGNNQTFNKDKIHTIQKIKYDKSKKSPFYTEYSIDRVNGNFTYRKKTYDPDPRYKKYPGVKNGILIVDFIGSCEKKSEDRKF